MVYKRFRNIKVFLFISLFLLDFKGFSQGYAQDKNTNSIPSYNSIEEIMALSRLNNIRTYSEEGSDVLFYANLIIKKHINFNRLVDFRYFCDECARAMARLDQLALNNASREERHNALYFELCKLAALLHDQHTFIKTPKNVIENYDVYAVNFTTIEKKLIITALGSMYENNVGSEVTEINGLPVEQVHKAIKSIISYSTEAYAIRQADFQLNIKQSLEAVGLGSFDGRLTIKLADGNTMVFEPVPYSNFAGIHFNLLQQSFPKTIYTDSWYEGWDLTNDCLFVKYNVSKNAQDYKVSAFVSDVFNAYDANDFSSLIIDFRSNSGSDPDLLKGFIKKIEKYIAKNKCHGYVLIGADTFSTAVDNVVELKKAGCILVGTPTGGAINYYGDVRTFELPNSRFLAAYGSRFHVNDKNANSKSVIPDVFVDFSVDDYILGNDSQVNWILKNIESKRGE